MKPAVSKEEMAGFCSWLTNFKVITIRISNYLGAHANSVL